MTLFGRSWLGAAAMALALSACGEQERILQGERLDYRNVSGEEEPVTEAQEPVPFNAPAATRNADWPHPGGSVRHLVGPAALELPLTQIWSVAIGEGDDRRHRITASPVVAGGIVYAMDSRARVSAVSTTGQPLWSVDLTPPREGRDDVSGGGLSVSDGVLFATTTFGRLVALDARTGAEIWTHRFESAASGAATPFGSAVYVVTRDGRGWALDRTTGQILWSVEATEARAAVTGAPSPVATPEIVVFPFASGELVGIAPDTGTRLWSAYVLGSRLGRAYARVTDITGDPVVSGSRVYAGSHSGRMAAVEIGTGQTAWTADDGALSPVWVGGGSVFAISDQSELLRLDAASGEVLWRIELPYFTRERARRQKRIFAHHGPILAGGALIVVSDDEQIRAFSPESGALIGAYPLPGGAASEAAIADGTLYVVTTDGRLSAFR